MQQLGQIVAIHRYPVKSMGGHSVDEAAFGPYGLHGDRRYAFVKDGNSTRFPWLTARDLPLLLRYLPRLVQPADPAASPVAVATPDGRELALDDPALVAELAEQYGHGVHLRETPNGQGFFDTEAISVVSTATLRALSEMIGFPVEQRRFRSNIVVDIGDTPFLEERWLDATLRFGDSTAAPSLRINGGIGRCMMVNLDPDSAQRDARVLRAVAQQRDNCVSVSGVIVRPGTLRVGDVLALV